MRRIMLTGRIVEDVQKRVSVTSNTEFFNIRIANNEFGDEKDENGKPITYWFRATCFNPQLFRMIPYLKKGSLIMIIGKYSDSLYQNKEGNCDINRDIVIESIDFVGNNNTNGENNGKNTNNISNTNSQKTEDKLKVTNKGASKKQETLKATKEVLSDDAEEDDELPF